MARPGLWGPVSAVAEHERNPECETGRPAEPQRGGQGAPALGQGSPSIQITSQPCLDQLDTPAHRHQEHNLGCPPTGQGASPPPMQATACDLGPITTASSSRANQLAPRDRAAGMSLSLQRVTWIAGYVTYVPRPWGGQVVAAAGIGCIQGSKQLSHPIPAPPGTPWHSWGGQVGKTTPDNFPLSRPRPGLGSCFPSP